MQLQVITLKNVVLIVLPLIAIVLSIIAIAVAMSSQKDHHTSQVNDVSSVHKQSGEDQDINEVKRNMEVTLADIKSKLSSKCRLRCYNLHFENDPRNSMG